MAVEPRQAFVSDAHPQFPAHGVEDARLDGAGEIVRIGPKAKPVASILLAGIFKEKSIRQQRHNPADALFVVGILLPMARLFAGRTEQTIEPRLLL